MYAHIEQAGPDVLASCQDDHEDCLPLSCRQKERLFLRRLTPSDESLLLLQVSHSRRWLNKWWKVVGRRYDDRQLIWDGDDFFKAGGKWLRAGTAYRLLAEPIDISNWYKCRIHDPSTGDNYNGHYAGKDNDDSPACSSSYINKCFVPGRFDIHLNILTV